MIVTVSVPQFSDIELSVTRLVGSYSLLLGWH